MKKILQSEKGLTLVELIAAFVIITILLISFFSFFSQGAKYSEINDDSIKASNLARQVLEELRSNNEAMPVGEYTSFNNTGKPTISLVEQNGVFHSNAELKLKLVFSDEVNTDLVKVKIEILQVSGKSVTETYGYLEVG
ncbi:type II secretory pathway pseudopilin PulG [Salirhabdus euzebyi]|uniref:Type II secretory pathway pseudopilin PulG n=1 Tax=Salirhabdus euzebyi TaxID=394506 RepID=A0A841Q9S4_9BACI|nr:type II secretion system protein [Salirhabdus euzebyi]MBB6455053.1 type II secretory pathway pseudopilin PulG [Salirhabdus euzebyi]